MSEKAKPDPIRVGITWQEPTMLQIGKSGLTEGIVKEAKRLLNKHRYMKVRFLRSALESESKDSAIVALCEQIGAAVVGIRGNTAVIYKIRKIRTDE